jgi:hypothetical protein
VPEVTVEVVDEPVPTPVNLTLDDGTSAVLVVGSPGRGVPAGGTTGQALVKASNTDYDTEWDTIAGGGGAVDSVNGETGVVVLAAADVGADPEGSAAAAQAAAVQRANHTGTQTSASISDFAEAAQDAVAAALIGSGVTVSYNDNANTLTIAGVGDLEAVRDALGVALVGLGLISVTVDDNADTITIATTATQNSTDAALRDRSTHTGTQAIATVSGLQAVLDDKLELGDLPVADEDTVGIVELADGAETVTGALNTKAVHPAGLSAFWDAVLSSLANVATSGSYSDLSDTPDLSAKADLVGGLVPTSQIPSLALTTTHVVASQAAMLALTTSQAQPGDLAVRTDGAGTFILTDPDPSVLANWTRLNAPTDAVTTVNGQSGTVVLGKSDVGLGNVDNTSDANKPVSTAQQAALDLKAPIASPTFTGTVSGVSKSMVGLGSVDNTSDANKPISTATQTALDAKAPKQESVNTVASSGSTETIPDPTTAESISRITLDANCTFTFPTAGAGRSFTLILIQDGTGSRTVTWPGTVKWPNATAPTLTTTANKIDVFTFLCADGTNWLGFAAGRNYS